MLAYSKEKGMSRERRNKAFGKLFCKTSLAFEKENNCQNNSLKIQ